MIQILSDLYDARYKELRGQGVGVKTAHDLAKHYAYQTAQRFLETSKWTFERITNERVAKATKES